MRMQSRGGFALPLAIFVLGFLTVGVAAAYTRVENESRINRDRAVELDAFAVAESGLQYYLLHRRELGFDTFPPPDNETITLPVPGGNATITTRVVRAQTPGTDGLYHVRSTGVVTAEASNLAPPAQRTVSTFSLFRTEQLQISSAWTSLSGLAKNGTAGEISGIDHCTGSPAPTIAGIAVPTDMWDTDGLFVPEGDPPVREMGTKEQMTDSVHIDWQAILNGESILPDLYLPTPNTWSDVAAAYPDPEFWPVVRYDGNASLLVNGKGILIVTGDLNFGGSVHWDGIVLVGGAIYANGVNNVQGTVISGLNEEIGISVGPSSIGNGNKTFVYHSCNVARALQRISILRVVPGTWSDNWATY